MSKQLLKPLQELGLTENEGLVYLSLLRLGTVTTGPIIEDTGLHRQFVYTALERLQTRGLASFVSRRNRKLFSASPPSILLQLQQQRLMMAQELLPELLNFQTSTADGLKIRVLRGEDDFYANLLTVVESAARYDRIMRIIGGGGDARFYELIGQRKKYYEAACRKARVRKHLLAPELESHRFTQEFAHTKGNVLKRVPQGLSSPSYTRITPELTTIEIYLSDVVIIQIWSREVALGYLEHFNLLWDATEAYRPGLPKPASR